MNCATTRHRLLTAERPDRPPAVVRPHLADCPACQDWLRNLAELESQVPALPVPASSEAKIQVLRRLREWPAATVESLRLVPPELPFMPAKERGLRKLSVAFALAAAVVLFAIGLSLWPRHHARPEGNNAVAALDPEKAMRDQRDAKMQAARTPRQKVECLAEFAHNLLREAREPEALPSVERLALLARVYAETIRGDLQDHARELAADEKPKLLTLLADDLRDTESQFERLVAIAPEASREPLRQIAEAARDGQREMRRLASGAAA